MSAMLNALAEEGSKEDVLAVLANVIIECAALRQFAEQVAGVRIPGDDDEAMQELVDQAKVEFAAEGLPEPSEIDDLVIGVADDEFLCLQAQILWMAARKARTALGGIK
jgi:hypothetical protein